MTGAAPPPLDRAAHGTDLLVVLADPVMRTLAAARFLAVLGSAMIPTALAFGVLDAPGGDATSLGIVLAAGAVAQALTFLPGGVVADRYGRRRSLVTAELLVGGAAAGLALLFVTGRATTGSLAALVVVQGMGVGLFGPAFVGFVPEVADPDRYQTANAVLRLTVNVARIVGTAMAGLLVAGRGPSTALAVAGVGSFAAALLLVRVRVRHPASSSPSTSALRTFREGWREFVSRRWVVDVVVLAAIANLGISAYLGVLGPLQSDDALSGASSWATITSAAAVGTLLGALVAVRIRPRRPLALSVVTLSLFSLPLFAMAGPAHLVVIIAASFVSGVAIEVSTVLWDTALQDHVPRDALSRVAAFDWLGSFGLAPVALAVAGPLVDAVGETEALLIGGALAALPVLALLDPQIRRLRPGPG